MSVDHLGKAVVIYTRGLQFKYTLCFIVQKYIFIVQQL